ncbi:MAG: tRNA preQ1(34) S-adenosylmethionine ribosyltransferase-isomerase QueA [Planctomycetota bacterium]|jgi:S-adenosylmethionine:tRNA ribosyltransferase-isomerase|nr:MAG: tRNA preQ1(34) S-adenosylmethionine ribosyltransferase-isomerase QueA [Planctomycetota bacterium]
MQTTQLDYHFDETLVATTPVHPREDARLMVVNRSLQTIEHASIGDLARYIDAGDRLILNRSSVLRARVLLESNDTQRTTEGLLLEATATADHWRMLMKHSKRFAVGNVMTLRNAHGALTDDTIHLVARDREAWIVRVEAGAGGGSLAQILERSGHTPLPPYILSARKDAQLEIDDDIDRVEYETVYADQLQRGSIAAPTAGLHFTHELLATLAAQGVTQSEVVLHVGAGTFKPIACDDLHDHVMHHESFMVPRDTLRVLESREFSTNPRARGQRLIAVGTTSVRALESLPATIFAANASAEIAHDGAYHGSTQLLITPGHNFRYVDALLTNFHLPRSTLLALVGAFAGMELMHEAYATAVRMRYRFYSYGDAMLIV